MKHTIICGHVLDVLKKLPDESVDAVITSPPYWGGLRDYGEETCTIWDGDPACKHEWAECSQKFSKPHHGVSSNTLKIASVTKDAENKSFSSGEFCKRCGAWRGQLGHEPSLNLYIEHLLEIMQEVKRVLKKTGVIFWNMGDCYSNQNTILKEYSIEDDWLRLLGWIYTDGTVLRNGSRICIYQSKQQYIPEIESLLNRLGLRYTKHGPHKGNFMFYILAEDSRKINKKLSLNGKKILPEWLYFCSRRQIIVLLEAIINGDGSRRKYDTPIYGTKERLEPLRELLESKDISCRLYQNKRGDWILQIHQELWNPKYIKERSLCLQNERFIIRCVDELGFILRDRIIWTKRLWISKTNSTIGSSMPTSAKDRCSFSYEPVYVLTKSPRYYWDQDAIRTPLKAATKERVKHAFNPTKGDIQGAVKHTGAQHFAERVNRGELTGANRPNVWFINLEPSSLPHYAAFPTTLVSSCLLAGCPRYICKKCGRPRRRITDKNYLPTRLGLNTGKGKSGTDSDPNKSLHQRDISRYRMQIQYKTLGWTDCDCNAGYDSGVVMDIFAGTGTVGVVAEQMGFNSIQIDLNKEYCEIAYQRLKPLVAQTKLGREPSVIEKIGF